MQNLNYNSLNITFEKKDNKAVMIWYGKSDERSPEDYLNGYINTIINDIKDELIIDFRQLSFINSSTYVPIIKLIISLDKKGIKTILIYNKNSEWQEISFRALQAIANQLKNISIEGK